MIDKNLAIQIRKVANGWLVAPALPEIVGIFEQYVFIDKGYVSASRDHQDKSETLFGWLDQHFTDLEQE